ncbi:MAG: DUF1203 domain-containing protein [Ilumatobacteraceae bacterium]
MTATTFRLEPISPSTADSLRARGGPVFVADAEPGYPCRQCLRDAAIGDELVLVSHDPFDVDSPYRSASPIFLHRQPCGQPADDNELPEQLTSRMLSVRSFDRDAMMIDAAVIGGTDLRATIDRLFTDDSAQRIHVHNATRGCWAVGVRRTSA